VVVTDNWIEFTVRYVVDYRQRRITKDAIMRSLLVAFEENKQSVAFGSATLRDRGRATGHLRTSDAPEPSAP